MANKAEEPTYDLTTVDGMKKAITDYTKQNPKKAAAMGALLVLNPAVPLVMLAANGIGKVVSNLFNDPEKVIKAQKKAAVDIIKAGKANGVKKMKVTLDQNAGADVSGELQGYSLKFKVGNGSTTTIEVEY